MANSKGTNLIDMVKFLRSRKQQALDALSPRLHGYLERRIVVSDWYPERDLYELMLAFAKLMPGSGAELYRQIGVLTMRNHLNGSYRHLLSGICLETLPVRANALWKSLHDTGEMVVGVTDARTGSVLLREYENLGPEMCLVIESYIAEQLRLAGLDDVCIDPERCVHHGADDCCWRFRGEPRTSLQSSTTVRTGKATGC